jgi:hypothetical protein
MTTQPQETTVYELRQHLQALREQSLARQSPEQRAITDDLLAKLDDSRLLERCVKTGDIAPDFTLPNVRGEEVRLSDALRQGPVVLAFYRGGW